MPLEAAPKTPSPKTLPARVAAGKAQLIDLRERDEMRRRARVPAARALSLSAILAMEGDKRAQWPEGITILSSLVLLCSSGARELRAAAHLRALGFETVLMAGGIAGWQKLGGRVLEARDQRVDYWGYDRIMASMRAGEMAMLRATPDQDAPGALEQLAALAGDPSGASMSDDSAVAEFLQDASVVQAANDDLPTVTEAA